MRSRDLPNQKKKYSELNGRLARYVSAVQSLYDDLCRGAANAVVIEEVGEGKFSFGDNKALERKIEDLQSQFVSEMQVMIHRGTSEEWRRSNEVQDMIADKVVGTYTRQKRVKLPTISLSKVGSKDAELTDDYHDFCLPKGVRERIGEIEKIKTFNQIKAYFESKGIFLETDVKSLLRERGDEYIEAVASAGQNIIAAYESYIEVYGKDALKKLRGIRLKDDSCKSTASYHYNAIGEKDPLEGVICFRQFGSAGGHNVFHEFAHCYQDSQVRGGEDAVMAADRIMESIKEKPAGVRAYFGADKNAANAEAMAEGFAYAFKYGDKEYVDFLKSVQSYQSRESVRQSHRQYYLANGKQLEAFQNRRDRGLNLSDKLWRQSKDMRTAMEDAISCALEKGIDAVTLSKKLSQYLRDFDSMKADYKERFGSASNAKDCEYRSIRLARSEINMAYRKAEQERWQQFDFVLGYEIKLSGSHPAHDVCDHLAGKYPKDFVWTGWHPNDMCYVVPILMSEEEYFEDKVSDGGVKDVPPQFIDWCKENEGRIGESYAHGTAPYFVRDNSKYVLEAYGESSKIYKGILHKEALEISKAAKYVGGDLQELASGLASKYGGVVTDINYKSTQSIERKCATDRTNPSSLKDVVRTTIIVDEDKIESVLSELSDNEMFVRLKRQRPEKFNGYSGNIVNMRMPRNGIQGEIQVNTAKMIYAKEPESVARKILGDKVWESISKETGLEGGLGHKYYEEIRVLDMLDPKQKEMRIQLEKKMREYYKKFR